MHNLFINQYRLLGRSLVHLRHLQLYFRQSLLMLLIQYLSLLRRQQVVHLILDSGYGYLPNNILLRQFFRLRPDSRFIKGFSYYQFMQLFKVININIRDLKPALTHQITHLLALVLGKSDAFKHALMAIAASICDIIVMPTSRYHVLASHRASGKQYGGDEHDVKFVHPEPLKP